jgi:alkylation response protein AidB-like acyl-CoA dehydrogenase
MTNERRERAMQYELTEEQRMLQDMVRRLAREKVEPGAAKRDAEGQFAWEMVDLMRENGLYGIDFPEAYGGSGAGMLALAIAVEELSKVDAACGLLVADHELGSLPIMLAGDEEQKQRFLPKLSAGEHLAAFALTEPAAGSDVARLRCRAVKDGASYTLNGTKNFITNGGVADIITVYALTDPEGKPHKNAGVFVVEKDTPGFSVGKKEDKLGIRWSDTVELIFEDCRIPAENLLGQEGEGFHVMMKTLDFSRPGVAAQALGIAAGALEYATAYAKERESFGKPIIRHQGVGFKLAEMAMRTEAARQLLYKTCALYQEQPKDMSRMSPELIRMSAMSKCYCGDVAMWAAIEAVQVLGGYGYIKEFPVERMMRDAKITQIYEGTNEIMRLVISNTL